jgi:hypothetical protein
MVDLNKELDFYVIDKNHEVLQCSERVQKKTSEDIIGMPCYSSIHGYEHPCRNCLLHNQEENMQVFYSTRQKKWIERYYIDVKVPGKECCKAVIFRDVNDRALEINAELSIYDEVIFFSPKKNAYELAYHRPNQHLRIETKGHLDYFVQEMIEFELISKNEHEKYKEIWNLDTLEERISQKETQRLDFVTVCEE